jgi:tetratricopeptide (TPR) repeat protein
MKVTFCLFFLVSIFVAFIIPPVMAETDESHQLWQTAYNYREENKCSEALDYSNRAIAADPSWAPPFNVKGASLSCLGKYDEAIAAYDKAISLNTGWEKPWSNKGYVYLKQGKCSEALDAFTKALALMPDFEAAKQGRIQATNCQNNISTASPSTSAMNSGAASPKTSATTPAITSQTTTRTTSQTTFPTTSTTSIPATTQALPPRTLSQNAQQVPPAGDNGTTKAPIGPEIILFGTGIGLFLSARKKAR